MYKTKKKISGLVDYLWDDFVGKIQKINFDVRIKGIKDTP